MSGQLFFLSQVYNFLPQCIWLCSIYQEHQEHLFCKNTPRTPDTGCLLKLSAYILDLPKTINRPCGSYEKLNIVRGPLFDRRKSRDFF